MQSDEIQTAIFTLLLHILLPGENITRMYLYLLKQALSVCMAAVKSSPYVAVPVN